MSEQSLRDKVIKGINAQPQSATLHKILECVIIAAADAKPDEPEPEQWKLDVNDRYQAAVGVITSLSTAAMVLPVVLLRGVLGRQVGQSIADQLNTTAYAAWACLGGAVFFAIVTTIRLRNG